MSANERVNFGSKIGIILASAGSAVGLGNIWRFPCEVGENGGAAFILVYILCVMFLGIPVMVSEFLIGRRSRANTGGAYEVLAPGTHWKWVGMMGVVAAFLILGYYGVVAGWTLEYMVASATGRLSGSKDYTLFFNDFVGSPWKPVLYMAAFILLTHVVIVRGVKDGHREVLQSHDAVAAVDYLCLGGLFLLHARFVRGVGFPVASRFQ